MSWRSGSSGRSPVSLIDFDREEVNYMAALLTSLGEVVNAVMTYVGTICTTIVAQPLLLMTTGFLLIGGCIGIFGRLLSKG